jgi:hypothetical protein
MGKIFSCASEQRARFFGLGAGLRRSIERGSVGLEHRAFRLGLGGFPHGGRVATEAHQIEREAIDGRDR